MDYLNVITQIANILTGFSLIILIFQFNREKRGQNLEALFYLHEYLAQNEFSLARYKARKELCNKHYEDWDVDDRNIANKICSSYDQAGLLISLDIMDKITKKKFLQSSWGVSICEQYSILENYLNDRQTPNKIGRDFFCHFTDLNALARKYHNMDKKITKVKKLISGGQSGVDRAGIDFAIANFINYGGWCPNGGYAEDYPNPPGVLDLYSNLTPTPSKETSQRTIWNVRDSDATIIIIYGEDIDYSKGTSLTLETAKEFNKPVLVIDIKDPYQASKTLSHFISTLKDSCIINLAGPRESEATGIYIYTYRFLEKNKHLFL